MTNKKTWLALSALTLVFGLTVIACGGNRLEGSWVPSQYGIIIYGNEITFGRNTITMGGDFTFNYTTRGNSIIVTFDDGESIIWTYSIDGDILILTIDDETFTLTRRR